MKILQLNLLSLLLAATIAFTGCKKDEGPTGPQRPQGPTGNANVQSEMITVFSSDWVEEGNMYTFETPTSLITEDIAESGAVLCYLMYDDIYRPMPISYLPEGEDYTTHAGFEYMTEEIFFFFQTDDGMTPAPGERTFKVVTIESKMLESNPEIATMKYADAMQLLGGE